MQSPVGNFVLKQPVYKVPSGKIIENCVHLIRERAFGMSAAERLRNGGFWEAEDKGDKN